MTITPKMLFDRLVVKLPPITFQDKQFFNSIDEMRQWCNENNFSEGDQECAVFKITRLIGDKQDQTTYDGVTNYRLSQMSQAELEVLALNVVLYLEELFNLNYVLTDKDGITIAKLWSLLTSDFTVGTFWPKVICLKFNGKVCLRYSAMIHRWLAPQMLKIFDIDDPTKYK